MDDFQSQVLAAAQATGLVPPADGADPDEAASETTEPVADADGDLGLARDEDAADDDAFLADDDGDAEDADADGDEPEPSEREAQLLREVAELRERETRREAERIAAEQERTRAQWAQAERGLDGWLDRSLATLEQRAMADEQMALRSEDPQAMRNHLAALRQRDRQWVWSQYQTQKQVYEQQKTGALMTALAQTQVRQWAEETARRYGLPQESAAELMRYADGTPVHPDAMPARAAELAEQRRRERNLKRQLSQAKRSRAADALRANTGVAPGGGQPRTVPQFKNWRDELRWAAEQHGIGR
jgi:hypothetical protein